MNHKIVWGTHAVKAVVESHPEQVAYLYLKESSQKDRRGELESLAHAQNISVKKVPLESLEKLCGQANHQGVCAILKETTLPTSLPELMGKLVKPAFLLVLDGVQDPHNLGACLRSANAAGVDGVIIPKDKSVGMTSVVRKVACGAAELTPVLSVTNIARTIDWLKEQGVWVYGAAEKGSKSLFSMDFSGPIAVVLGSEGEGMRRLTQDKCDELFFIPTVGKIQTLNVSVATGVTLFEVVRQRLKSRGD